MSSGSFASAGIDSKRQRALPIPRASANMKTFTPDSSIASDVIPSANYGDRNKGRLPDMIVLHYTGMPDVEGAIAQLCTAGTDVSAHYIVLEDGRIVQCVPESQARLACRRGVLGRRGRHQFLFDRHRDRQSRPRLGLSGFSAAPDRRRDRAVPRHHAPPQGAVASRARRIPTSRPRARRIPARNFRGIRWPIPASAIGCSRRRSCAAKRSSSAPSATTSRACSRRWPDTATAFRSTANMTAPTMEVVTAFQRHFRPARVDGIADHSTLTTLHALLASLPADATTTTSRRSSAQILSGA